MNAPIRLACQNCDTDECDGVDEIPPDWTDVFEVQSFEQSCIPVTSNVNDLHHSAFSWYTHLGLCPKCRESD